MITYPRALAFARTCRLPMVVCSVTKELYGYAKPILDEGTTTRMIKDAGYRGEEVEAALSVLRERASRLSA